MGSLLHFGESIVCGLGEREVCVSGRMRRGVMGKEGNLGR